MSPAMISVIPVPPDTSYNALSFRAVCDRCGTELPIGGLPRIAADALGAAIADHLNEQGACPRGRT